MILATLLLLILPSDIKQATQQHLMAMQNISATETVGKDSYRVAMFGGQQAGARPPIYHGVALDRAWFVLLRDSQVWHFVPAGDDHFTYSDSCAFKDRGNQLILPCSGEIFTQNADIIRIIQTFVTERWGAITIDIKYDWVTLSEPRLVPQELVLRWGEKEIKATWSQYREFRANEPKISEWSEENEREAGLVAEKRGDARRITSASDRTDTTGSGVDVDDRESTRSREDIGRLDAGNMDRTTGRNLETGVLNDRNSKTKSNVTANPETAQSASVGTAKVDVPTGSVVDQDNADRQSVPDSEPRDYRVVGGLLNDQITQAKPDVTAQSAATEQSKSRTEGVATNNLAEPPTLRPERRVDIRNGELQVGLRAGSEGLATKNAPDDNVLERPVVGDSDIFIVPQRPEPTNLLTPSQGETQTVKIKSRWWRRIF